MRVDHRKKTILHGITVSLAKRKIQRYQQKLGHGEDAELHLTVADLYKHLNEPTLALESYYAAAHCLLQTKRPFTTAQSDQLIKIYKRILTVDALNDDITGKLAQEYLRRGLQYRAIELHLSLAERYVRQDDYRKAIAQYQRVFAVEPGSITSRITCAHLYCQLGDQECAAREYAHIGDLYFEHQRFDGALEYYQQAFSLAPEDHSLKQKVDLTQQILEGALIPQAQASLQKLMLFNQHPSHSSSSLEEKQRIEQELRQNITQLKQRYQQSVAAKDEQLRTIHQQLDQLTAYVTVLKEKIQQMSSEKQHVAEQLKQELRQKQDLRRKLQKLSTFTVDQNGSRPKDLTSETQSHFAERVEAAVNRLHQEKLRLEEQLHRKLARSTQREQQLRTSLEQQVSYGNAVEQQLQALTRKRSQLEQTLQAQLQDSLQREHLLQAQMKRLIEQHEDALQHVKHDQYIREKAHQDRISQVETHNMNTLEQLHGELFRQYQIESNFSEKLHESLQEIAQLLHTQEQEIQKLEML